ncbi:MAG: YybS family protein [Clostridia bacterium]
MSTRNKPIVENVILLVVALVLLFISVRTILGIFAFMIVPVPFVLMAARSTGREQVLWTFLFAAFGALIAGVVGSILGILLAFIGGVMGQAYQKRKTGLSAVMMGAGASFLTIVLGLALAKFGFGVNLITAMEKTGEQLISGPGALPTPGWMSPEDWKKEVQWQMQLFEMVLPSIIVATSFFMSASIHWVSRLVSRLMKRPLPALPPIREWNFPRSLIYYYFAALIMLLLFGEPMSQSFMSSAVNNVKVMLDMIFMLQGLSFCFFFLYRKGWKKLSFVLVIALFIFPLLTYILSLLGILDLGVGLRKRLEKRK